MSPEEFAFINGLELSNTQLREVARDLRRIAQAFEGSDRDCALKVASFCDEIIKMRLQANRIDRLEDALKPFAALADAYDGNASRSAENPWGGGHHVKVRLSWCRKAREVLREATDGQA